MSFVIKVPTSFCVETAKEVPGKNLGRYFVSKFPSESAGIKADIDTVQNAGVTNRGLYPNP